VDNHGQILLPEWWDGETREAFCPVALRKGRPKPATCAEENDTPGIAAQSQGSTNFELLAWNCRRLFLVAEVYLLGRFAMSTILKGLFSLGVTVTVFAIMSIHVASNGGERVLSAPQCARLFGGDELPFDGFCCTERLMCNLIGDCMYYTEQYCVQSSIDEAGPNTNKDWCTKSEQMGVVCTQSGNDVCRIRYQCEWTKGACQKGAQTGTTSHVTKCDDPDCL
jgi:hypothetical protein